ncbi:MAG: isoprenylcysteine carboxylmethyltransferase family protein [Candidatus Promineifilaceae bacterium]|nr:isoprenylcysteine carboxylmethyltransferase family protein [Candidatus Promineifilaceae bacterium]
MALTDGFRIWFIVLYTFGLTFFIVTAVTFRSRREAVEKQEGPLPSPGVIIPLGLPLLILLTRFGEIPAEWLPLRWIGVILSLYFVVMLPWATATLGRLYSPGFAVFEDHTLITSGPFGFVRHPIGSSVLALWLGAGLGTLNWLLLALWPLFAALTAVLMVRIEEGLLREKFGAEYEKYAQGTSKLIPGVW